MTIPTYGAATMIMMAVPTIPAALLGTTPALSVVYRTLQLKTVFLPSKVQQSTRKVIVDQSQVGVEPIQDLSFPVVSFGWMLRKFGRSATTDLANSKFFDDRSGCPVVDIISMTLMQSERRARTHASTPASRLACRPRDAATPATVPAWTNQIRNITQLASSRATC